MYYQVAVGVLSELVLEIQIFDIISSKYSEICSIFPAFFPHSIIKFVISKILRTSKSWKQRFFKAEAFGNTRYGESDNEEKAFFHGFAAGSDNTPTASRRRFELSAVFAVNSLQYFVKMLGNTLRITCAFSLSCFEFIAKTSSNSPFAKNCRFLVRKAKMGWRPSSLTIKKDAVFHECRAC